MHSLILLLFYTGQRAKIPDSPVKHRTPGNPTCDQNTNTHSKLDYCNSLFLNLDSTQIQHLQLIENSLARAVTRTLRHHHITSVLKSLHWLKIPERIHFKVLSLPYNFLQSSEPTYLCELLTIQPTRSTRSSSCLTLSRPPVTSHLTFSIEPYLSLHHVSGMTCHLNSAPILYLHHHHSKS